MNFEKIQELNGKLPYKNIKGKNYIQVNDRVLAFRQLYPNGRIQTEIIKFSVEHDSGATVIVKASVYDGDALIATGHAFENPSKNKNINQFSALENCETSAVGRALGFLGIGATDSIASLDELPESERQAEPIESPNNYAQQLAAPVLISPENKAVIEKLYKGENMQRLLDHYQIVTLDQLEDRIAVGLIQTIAKKQKEKKGNK
jgi:hypothetical protein